MILYLLLLFGFMVRPVRAFQVSRGVATVHAPRRTPTRTTPSFAFDAATIGTQRTVTVLKAVSRRDVLLRSGAAVLGGSQASTTTSSPLVDLPLQKVKLPQGGFGGDYVTIPLKIGNSEKPYTFMIDTGLTLELITPQLQRELGLSQQSAPGVQSFGAGGSSGGTKITQLHDTSIGDFRLPGLNAIVNDFPQSELGNIQGMLGMEFLQNFDVLIDIPHGRFALYSPGKAPKDGLVPIPAVVINETGLWGIRTRTSETSQPVLALIDCGSSFTCVNNAAAPLLGIGANKRSNLAINALGVDGRPLQLPLIQAPPLTFAGPGQSQGGRLVGFGAPPREWKPWKPVTVAVGDLPVFSSVIGDGVRPYQGPAVLMGLDILSQRRWVMEASTKSGRERTLYMAPS